MIEELVNFKSNLFEAISDFGYSLVCEPDEESLVFSGSGSDFSPPKFTEVFFDEPDEAYKVIREDALLIQKSIERVAYSTGNNYKFFIFKEPDYCKVNSKKFSFSYAFLDVRVLYSANVDRRC